MSVEEYERRQFLNKVNTSYADLLKIPEKKIAYLSYACAMGATASNSSIRNKTKPDTILTIRTNIPFNPKEGLRIGEAGETIENIVGNADNYLTVIIILKPKPVVKTKS